MQGTTDCRVERNHYCLSECLSEDMKEHPEKRQSRYPVPALSGIGKQCKESDNEAQSKPSTPGEIGGSGELNSIVKQDCVAPENLSQQPIAKVIKELGDHYSQNRPKNGGHHEGWPYSAYGARA